MSEPPVPDGGSPHKEVVMAGVPGSSKSSPYAGPVFSAGTKDQDSKNNQGAVAGPKGGMKIPDPFGYKSGSAKKGK